MISDTAIGQIKQMKDISSSRADDHIFNYENIMKEMSALGEEALGAMSDLASLTKDERDL